MGREVEGCRKGWRVAIVPCWVGSRHDKLYRNQLFQAAADKSEAAATGSKKPVMTKTEQRTLNRLVQKEVQKTKAFRTQQQMKSKKDAKKSRFGRKGGKKKTLTKREKHYNPKRRTQ